MILFHLLFLARYIPYSSIITDRLKLVLTRLSCCESDQATAFPSKAFVFHICNLSPTHSQPVGTSVFLEQQSLPTSVWTTRLLSAPSIFTGCGILDSHWEWVGGGARALICNVPRRMWHCNSSATPLFPARQKLQQIQETSCSEC